MCAIEGEKRKGGGGLAVDFFHWQVKGTELPVSISCYPGNSVEDLTFLPLLCLGLFLQ